MVAKSAKPTRIDRVELKHFGMHCDDYEHRAYLTAAASIGMTSADLERFVAVLHDVMTRMYRQRTAADSA